MSNLVMHYQTPSHGSQEITATYVVYISTKTRSSLFNKTIKVNHRDVHIHVHTVGYVRPRKWQPLQEEMHLQLHLQMRVRNLRTKDKETGSKPVYCMNVCFLLLAGM